MPEKWAAALCVLLALVCLPALGEEGAFSGEWIIREEVQMEAGELRWFDDEGLCELAPNGKTAWSSSDPSAAKVDRWGNVRAADVDAVRQVYIVAERDGVSWSWKVTVRPLSREVLVLVNGEELADNAVWDLDANGAELQLSAQVLPEGAAQQVHFLVSGASLEESGLLTIPQDGVIKIEARAEDAGHAKAQYTLQAVHFVRTIAISGEGEVTSGRSIALQARCFPENASIKKVYWESSDPAVAAVDQNGNVTGGSGETISEALITACAADGSGVCAQFSVRVIPAAQKVTISHQGQPWPNNTILLDDSAVGGWMQLSAQVWPEQALAGVEWSSSDKSVVRIAADGRMEIVGKGRCRIAAKSADGSAVRILYVAVGDMDDLPYYLEIDKGNQVVRVYEKDENGLYTRLLRRMVCSTGKSDSGLENKLYTVHSTRARWMSTVVDGVMCQYGTRFEEHIWFHSLPYFGYNNSCMDMDAYAQLGSRASHGCIRLLAADAKWIYENAPKGTWTLVCRDERVESEYGAVCWPGAQNGWDPTDDAPENPYYDALYSSLAP